MTPDLQTVLKALDQVDLELDGGTEVGTLRIFLESLTEVWGIHNPHPMTADLPPLEVRSKERAEQAAQEHAKRGTYIQLVRRYATRWEK
jgi:hypothetical protein